MVNYRTIEILTYLKVIVPLVSILRVLTERHCPKNFQLYLATCTFVFAIVLRLRR